MGVFNNMSLRRKQTLVIMLTNSIALFLASDLARYVTGSTLEVHGGYRG